MSLNENIMYNINEAYKDLTSSLYRYLGGPLQSMNLRDLGVLYGLIEDTTNHMAKCREIVLVKLKSLTEKAQAQST